jgi:hypothetical protein
MVLTQNIGDNVTHRIPLRWNRAPFTPAGGWFLIFTVKADADADVDAQAKIQKTSDLGIAVYGSNAAVSIVPFDTAGGIIPDTDPEEIRVPLPPGTYYWDIQAQSVSNPASIRTVAAGTLKLTRDVTRGTSVSIPVYVASPGLTYDSQILTYS